jgi:selenocysteine-specific elongation factor
LPHDHPLTLGTAGHIDHGKTALVAALTGVDTDRLPQEKARGISIELGYAPLELPSGRRLSVVDVPGHERFVRAMVAGATGIDLWLLVIACDDGVMPQTREHLAILRLLGLERGVVALTKRDLVDAERAAEVRQQVEELVPGLPIVEVATPTGAGVDLLHAALDEAAASAPGREQGGAVRLPIDRSFTLRGIGTVVTGTLWSGSIGADDRLVLEPGARAVRVRSVQVHDQPAQRAGAGQRVAVALSGIERREARRGMTLAGADLLTPSYRLECELQVLPDAPRALRSGEVVTVHHGTAEVPARVALRDRDLTEPIVALAGDRVILRLTAPRATVGGGGIVDPAPSRSGRAPEPAAAAAAAGPAVRAEPSPAGAEELAVRIHAGGLTPPPLGAADQQAAAYLARQGRVVRVGRDLAFDAEAFAQATAVIVALAGDGAQITLAGVRDELGISRRYAQGLLEALDEQGVTRRIGDHRVLRRRGRELAEG